MDYNVKELLEKYWAGDSSLEEEQQLREYFHQPQIAPELERYRNLFNYFGTQQSVSMPGDISEAVIKSKLERAPEGKIISFAFWKIAAAAVLLIGLFTFYNNMNTNTSKAIVWEDTYENEEEALAKAKEVLLLVSRKMKKGTDKAAFSLSKAQLATDIVREQ